MGFTASAWRVTRGYPKLGEGFLKLRELGLRFDTREGCGSRYTEAGGSY